MPQETVDDKEFLIQRENFWINEIKATESEAVIPLFKIRNSVAYCVKG